MKCKKCSSKTLIKKGKVGFKQRYQCKTCNKYQQDIYSYHLYDNTDDKNIKVLNAEGVGISSMSRILGYSQGTIIRRILSLASRITRPFYMESNEVYEVDEMWVSARPTTPLHSAEIIPTNGSLYGLRYYA